MKSEEKERVELNQSLHILFWAIPNKTIIKKKDIVQSSILKIYSNILLDIFF